MVLVNISRATARWAVFPIVHRKTYAMLALLLACVTALMVIECQVHIAVSAHMTPTGHHHNDDASGDITGAIPCLLAVLPSGVSYLMFTAVWWSLPRRMVHSISPAFSLFIPPRNGD
jgi:hypothetical protein